MTDTEPNATAPTLREQIAAAIYERNNPGHRWAEAHPDDLLAYGFDADAALTAVLPHGKFLGDQLRDAEIRLAQLRALANRWQATVRPGEQHPAASAVLNILDGDGPSVREAAANDRRWPLEKAGE
jgi:transglutaminase-like putative cysteine protease